MSIIYLYIIHFAHAISKWSTFFKYYFLISIVTKCNSCCYVLNCYSCFKVYVCVTVITLILPYHCIMCFCDSSFISNQLPVTNLDGWFVVSSCMFIIFWYSVITWYYYINLRSSISFCLPVADTYLSLSIYSLFVSELFRNK